ncbi:MAG: CvpA family protein [Chloroflexi bacterium]|nr:CvpA family protein [Chloroflexota bacterium]
MMPIHTVFGVLVALFAVVGSLRGWAKELIVIFSVVLALFVEHVLLSFLPPVAALFQNMQPKSQFYTRASIFLIIAVFGYASPTIASRLGAKVARERLQDLLLGFFIGAINGYLVIGTLLSFLNLAGYGIPREHWLQQQRVDQAGNPIVDSSGQPVTVTVYPPDVSGIGGMVPPKPGSPTDNLIGYLPPDIIEKSDAVLYVAVAAAFIFVIVVFI